MPHGDINERRISLAPDSASVLKMLSTLSSVLVYGLSIRAAVAGQPGFVAVNGTEFWLDGKPFHFAGSNAYYFPFTSVSDCLYSSAQLTNLILKPQNGTDIEVGLRAAQKAGLKVFRTWGFNDKNRTYNPTGLPQYGVGENENVFQWWDNGNATINTEPLDKVVKAAAEVGTKLIVALTNNWADYGGMDVYTTNLGGKYHDDVCCWWHFLDLRPEQTLKSPSSSTACQSSRTPSSATSRPW
jgi:mannan endo-1,4-beta-mannosidase